MMKKKVNKQILSLCLAIIVMFTTVDSPLVYATDSTPESSAEAITTENNNTEETDNVEETGETDSNIAIEESGNDIAAENEAAESNLNDTMNESEVSSPAFDANTEVDDTRIHVTAPEGVFPEGSTVKVEKVTAEIASEIATKIADNVKINENVEKNIAKSYTFDIKVLNKDGVEIQPDITHGKVNITFDMDEVADENVKPAVYHVDNDYNVKELQILDKTPSPNGETAEDKSISVETDGFSYYTVEFGYESKQYVLNGDTEVKMDDVIKSVGLSGTVEAAESSNNDLLSVRLSDDGTWYVKANSAFTTEETLNVTIRGLNYQITVTNVTNIEERSISLAAEEPIEPQLYAILYESGELHFQYGNQADSTKGTVVNTYKVADAYTNYENIPWYSNKGKIKSVTSDEVTCPTSMAYWFDACFYLTSIDLSKFDTRNVTNMSFMFSGCSKLTSIDLSGFDTSNVTDMGYMFSNCRGLTSIDLSGFDTSNVTDMGYMFYDCRGLTSIDLSGLDTRNVTNMENMFNCCTGLTSIDLSGFNTSNVTNMSYMFASCSGLTSIDLSKLDTSNVTNMNHMFYYCIRLTNIDLSGLNTRNVTNMSYMFADCERLTSIDLSKLDMSNVTNMSVMFYECRGLTSIDLSKLDMSNVTSMNQMFYCCSNLTSVDLSGLNTSNVISMGCMFYGCGKLTSIDLSGLNTSNVTDMSLMFGSCSNLTSIDLSGFDTSNVTDMGYMFDDCEGLTSIDLSGFNTSNVTSMEQMFHGCENLTSIDLSGFDTSNVTNMEQMFFYCENLISIDLSRFDTSKVRNMRYIFSACDHLIEITLGTNWKFVGEENYLPVSSWRKKGTETSVDSLWQKYDGETMADTYERMSVILYENGELHFQYGAEPKCDGKVLSKCPVTDTGKIMLSYNWKPYVKCVKADETIHFKSMIRMFEDCKNLESVDFTNCDTSQVTDMSFMFKGCGDTSNIRLKGLDTTSVKNMSGMFEYCYNIRYLDLSNFTVAKDCNMNNMFSSCYGLAALKLGENWSFNNTNCLPSHNWIRYSTKEMIKSLENVYDGKTMADTYCVETKCKFYANGGLLSKTISYYIPERFGDDIIVEEPTRWGYVFDGWYDAAEGGNKLKQGDLLVKPFYYAHWISNDYNLILKSNGTDEADITKPMKADTFYQLSDQLFHKDGYILSGWNTKRNGSGKAFGANEYIGKLVDNESKEYILYAQWTPVNRYVTVSFETDGGSTIKPYQILKGSKLGNLSKSLKEGYTFIAWHMNSPEGDIPNSSTEITEDVVLYAEFKENPTITFDGNGQVANQTRQVRYNETIGELPTYKVSQDCPMTLIGWFTEKTGGDAINANTRVTEDVIYYAHWGWKPTFNADGGVILSDTKYPVQESNNYRFWEDTSAQKVDVKLESNNTYAFVDGGDSVWVSNNNSQNSTSASSQWTLTVPANTEYTITYTVSSEGGYDKLTVTLNDKIIVNGISGEQTGSYTIRTGAKEEQYSLRATYSKDGSGSSGNDQATITLPLSVKSNDCPLPTVRRDGYEFLGWFVDNGARKIQNGKTVDLSQYPEIRAKWSKLETYTVSLDVNGGTYGDKTLKILKDSSNGYGIIQGLGRPTRSDYQFIGWKDESGKDYQNGTHISSNVNLTAQWQKMNITVTFDPQEGTMYGSKTKKIAAGTSLNTIPGAKKSNMYLEGWYTKPDGQGEKLEQTTIINKDVTYYAFYETIIKSEKLKGFHHTFGAEWANANSKYVDNYNNNLEWHCDSSTSRIDSRLRFRYELNESDGTNVLPIGAVQIKVPKYIWKDWDGKWIGTANIRDSFTEYPTKGTLPFSYIDGSNAKQYSFLKDEENASDYYYIINDQPLEGGRGLDATITYSASAYSIKGGAAYINGSDWEYMEGYQYYKGEVPIEVKIDTDFNIEAESSFQADISKKLTLTNEMHTYVNSTCGAYDSNFVADWDSTWGKKPEDADDYFYVVWSWQSYFSNSAPFSAEWSEDTGYEGTVVKWLSNNKYNSSGQNSSSFYGRVVKKYPKTLFKNLPETGLVLKDAAILKTTWKSGYKTEQLASNSITIRDVVDNDTSRFEKRNESNRVCDKEEGQKKLMDDQALSMRWYLSYSSGSGKEDAVWDKDKKTFHMPNRQIELVDGRRGDIMYNTGNTSNKYAWEPDKGNIILNDKDYYISDINIKLNAWYPEYIEDTCVKINNYKHGQKYFDLYLRYAGDSEFVYYDTYDITPSGTRTISLPSGVAGYKIRLESDYYKTYLETYGTFIIKPTEHIKSLVSTDYWKETTSIFKDQSTCKVDWKDEQKSGEILNESNNKGGKNSANNVIYELTRKRPSSSGTDTSSYIYQYTKKTASSIPRVDVAKGVQDSYISIAGWNYKTSSGGSVEPITSGIFYDLLPVGTTVDEDTISGSYITGNYSNSNMPSGSRLKKELYHVRFEKNWENSNRTMMIIDCNAPSDVKSAGFKFDYMLRNSNGNVIENGTSVENDVAFVNTSSNRSILRDKAGDISTIKDNQYYKFLSDNTEDVPFTTYASAMVNYRQVYAFSWGVNKSVKSDSTDGLYEKENASTSPKNEYTYCLEFSQSDGARSSELVFYDVLEQGATITENGQKKTITSNWHGVLKDINVEAIAKKSSANNSTITCKPVIYYSTKDRDSFTEKDYDIRKSEVWSSKKPSDLSKVTAIAVDCSKGTDDSEFVFSNKDTLPIYVTMVAPYDTNGFNKSAYNTVTIYAKQGEDTQARSLTSYSQMVLKDINPKISIVTVPQNGTEQEPTPVFVDTGIDYDLNVKNTDEGLPAKDVKVEYTVPDGLYLDYSNMKFALDNSSGDLISNSPMITVKKDGKKLIFVIKRLAAGQTGHIIIPTTVIAEETVFSTSASITNVNGIDKDIESNKTYHKSIPMPAENPKVIVKKVNKKGDILGGAQLKITGRAVYESEDITPIIWTTEKGQAKKISLEPGSYVLHEESAPDGYVLNTSDISFEINDKDVELEMFNSEATTLQLEKVWNDGEDISGRPDSVDFEIYQDGQYLKDVTVKKADDWKLTVDGLAKYSANAPHKLCIYTVKEKSDGYIANYVYGTDLENQSAKIINTKVKTIKGTKKWNDNNESDLNRPANITVQLLQDGNEYKTQTVTAFEGWKYEFTGNPMYDASGHEYVYTIKEAYMEGYSVAYEKTNGGGLAITLDYQTESLSYDWIYVYYKIDDQLYRCGKYGGSKNQITLNIPSTEFWVQFITDGSNNWFYGFKVTNVQLLDNVSELPGSQIKPNEFPASELIESVDDWSSIESVHNPYPNNSKKCWNYVFNGAGSSERVDIVNTKLTDKYTKVQFKKVDKDDLDKNLANAHLQLLDTTGTVIQDWITGEEPEMFNAIAPGKYILHEESAPDGYRIAEDMNITITDTTEIQTFTMEDEREKNVALSVSQTVKGSGGNKNKAFNFNLRLTGGTDYPAELQYTITENGQEDENGTMTLNKGVGSFTLKHGQTITFAEVPNGLQYKVQELDGESQGYTVTYTNGSGILDEDKKVNVVNEKNISVPTLAHMNTTLSLVLMLLAIVGIAYLLWKRKKQFDS